jgi:hypothetical protein
LENFFNRNNGAKTKSRRRKRFHWDKICCLRQRPFLLISNIYSKFFFLQILELEMKEAEGNPLCKRLPNNPVHNNGPPNSSREWETKLPKNILLR